MSGAVAIQAAAVNINSCHACAPLWVTYLLGIPLTIIFIILILFFAKEVYDQWRY